MKSALAFGRILALVVALIWCLTFLVSFVASRKRPHQPPPPPPLQHSVLANGDGNWIQHMTEQCRSGNELSSNYLEDNDSIFKLMDGVRTVTTGPYAETETHAFGFSDYYSGQAMKYDARFPIASNSKLYTTVAIYQLQEKGLLNVDDDVSTMLDKDDFEAMGLSHMRRFCPRLRRLGSCQVLTLRHLLSMSSGIYPALNCDTPEHPELCNPEPYVFNVGSLARTVGTFLDKPLVFKPGTQYHYSNPNFILASYFVEKFSGMTFRDYLRTHIFDRIGLNDTYYDWFNGALSMDHQRVRQAFKYYHVKEEGSWEDAELISVGDDIIQLDLGAAAGTGGIISTAANEREFWYTLFHNSGAGASLFNDPSSLHNILTPISLMSKGQLTWNDRQVPVWMYYSQGVCLMCLSQDCHDFAVDNNRYAPRWVFYQGGTFTTSTANVLDLSQMAMSQVWSSTKVSLTPSREDFENVRKGQQGNFFEVQSAWFDQHFGDNIPRALAMLLQVFPPTPDEAVAGSGELVAVN